MYMFTMIQLQTDFFMLLFRVGFSFSFRWQFLDDGLVNHTPAVLLTRCSVPWSSGLPELRRAAVCEHCVKGISQ